MGVLAPAVIHASARVHPTADVEADVHIGPRSSIWHRAQVRRGARIGADCTVGRDAFIDEGVVIGSRVKIQNAALVYHGVTVDDGVFIGPNVTLTNDRYPRAIRSDGALKRPDDWEVSPIHLQTGASIGAGAVVVAGIVVGSFATVGAGAVVTHDVPAHALVVGNPARQLGWVCACGHRLEASPGRPLGPAENGPAVCPDCGARYEVSGEHCVDQGVGPPG